MPRKKGTIVSTSTQPTENYHSALAQPHQVPVQCQQ
jgi:hypothetical protein